MHDGATGGPNPREEVEERKAVETIRALAEAALQNLEAHRQRIDDLNVYPVPDGDTGTNLTLTMRSVVDAAEESTAESSAALAGELSRAALLGARGNSGVILSQIVRGFAEVAVAADAFSVADMSRGFRAASDSAYRAVKHPVEGTMLTVIREMAEEAERAGDENLALRELLREVVRRGDDAVVRTRDQLDLLRDAGVVDAGGAGLVEIVRGVALAVAGEPLPVAAAPGATLAIEAIHRELSRYRYCTGFVVEGEGLDLEQFETSLEVLGDSLLVVGAPSAIKVHLHTDDPGAAISAATSIGVIGRVEIADMHTQTFQRESRLLEAEGTSRALLETGIVAVCQGEGNRRLFEDLGATTVIEGGQSMNPSAAEIAEAIDATPGKEVIVLPNNSNVVSTAEQAVTLASRSARVVPSSSIQAGFAAMVRFVPTNASDENEAAMLEVLADAATGEVTIASRDADVDGVSIRKGEYLGLVDGRAVVSGEALDVVVLEVVGRMLVGRSWMAVLVGDSAPALDGVMGVVESTYPDLELEVHEGGQPHYPLLFVAE